MYLQYIDLNIHNVSISCHFLELVSDFLEGFPHSNFYISMLNWKSVTNVTVEFKNCQMPIFSTQEIHPVIRLTLVLT